jgi:2-hydroxycyclohexanecarboxyl-CoA dehydrogenase
LRQEKGLEPPHYLHCDVADRAMVDAAFDEAARLLGGLDTLLHIAGFELTEPAELIGDDHWDRMLDVNARGTMNTNQAAFRHLRETRGSIVNFGSAAGVTGMPGGAAYSASKGAVLAWTRTVAQEWGRFGIRVNAIAPGMWTPMYDKHIAKMTPQECEAQDRRMAMMVPLGGKLGNPDTDLTPFLLFMVSDGARFITGQTLAIDGGLLIP